MSTFFSKPSKLFALNANQIAPFGIKFMSGKSGKASCLPYLPIISTSGVLHLLSSSENTNYA